MNTQQDEYELPTAPELIPLPEDQITPELLKEAEEARNTPKSDFNNL